MSNEHSFLKLISVIVLFLYVSYFGSGFSFAKAFSSTGGEYEVWEAGGDANGNIYIGDEALSKLGLKKNGTAYLLNHNSRLFLFDGKKTALKYAKTFNIPVWKITEVGVDDGAIPMIAFYDIIGSAQDGVLIEEKDRGFAEILPMPEEIKQANRNMAIDAVIEDSGALGIWELKDEKEKIAFTADVVESLGIEKLEKVHIIYYGKRAFLFDDKVGAEVFFTSLLSAGAAIDDNNLKEVPVIIAESDKKDVPQEPVNLNPIKPLLKKAAVLALSGTAKQDVESAIARREKNMLKEFSLGSEIFGPDGFTLNLKGKNIIKQQAAEIKNLKYKQIIIEGHTSSSANRSANLALSQKRARAVYNELLANSIPAKNIKHIGFGGELPVANNKTQSGKLENRRVDVFVEGN